jgi:hypothetical protein
MQPMPEIWIGLFAQRSHIDDGDGYHSFLYSNNEQFIRHATDHPAKDDNNFLGAHVCMYVELGINDNTHLCIV